MTKRQMYFEQIPVALAKRLASEAEILLPRFANCAICEKPVALESCKTNESGEAVHDHCYLGKMIGPGKRKGSTNFRKPFA